MSRKQQDGSENSKLRDCKLSSLLMETPVNPQKIIEYAHLMNFSGPTLVSIALTYENLLETTNVKVSPVLLACSASDPEILKKLVKEGCSVNFFDGQCESPLRFALFNGNIPAAKTLLELGADPMQRINSVLPMEAAINNIHRNNKTCLRAVKLLLKNRVSAKAIVDEKSKYTALHLAVLYNLVPVVELLLSKGANPDAQTIDGYTPLHAAVFINKEEIIKLLLSNGADVYIENNGSKTPLIFAVEQSLKLCVKALIEGGCDVNRSCKKEENTPLHSAVNHLDLDMVKVLVGLGADLNKVVHGGVTPLHVLATRNEEQDSAEIKGFSKVYEDIAEYLIEKGGNINDDRWLTPLEVAVHTKNVSLSKIFIKLGANINLPLSSFSDDSLLYDIIVISPDTIESFLEYGWDYNARDDKELTPYHYAIQKNIDVKFIRSFVKQGCPYNQNLSIWHRLKKESNLALKRFFEAERNFFKGITDNNLSLVKSSIQKGAVITSCSEEIKYPSHFAACKGYKEVLTFLLEKGVPPNCVNEKGETALYIAAKCGHYEICCMLLRCGACYNVCNKKCPITPEMVARNMKHESILDMLHSVSNMFHLACSRKRSVIRKLKKKLNNSMDEYLIYANCINIKGDTLLGTAINAKCYTNVKKMLKLRLNIHL